MIEMIIKKEKIKYNQHYRNIYRLIEEQEHPDCPAHIVMEHIEDSMYAHREVYEKPCGIKPCDLDQFRTLCISHNVELSIK